MSLEEMLNSYLPMNRKEAFFTATVLPGIVCCNDFAHFSKFLKVLDLGDVTFDAHPKTANIQFFTEYSITEAAASKVLKERFTSSDFNSNERPDLLIVIDCHPRAKLIAIEAKMFSAVHPKNLHKQMDFQRQKILNPLEFILKCDILHLALLPKLLIGAWKKNKASDDAFSALCASSTIRIVTWEDILAPFKDGDLATYWVAILDTALRDFSTLAAKVEWHTHNDGTLPGAEIVEQFGSDGFYPMMGRRGGLKGQLLKADIESGSWKTHKYEVKSDEDPILNWFFTRDFILKIAQQSAKT